MKKFISLLIVCGLFIPCAAKLTKKPVFRPDWTYQVPSTNSTTYIYVIEKGEGETQREALNQAIGRVFQSTANRIGQFVSTDEIHRAVQSGTDYEVISSKMKIPVNKVCEFPRQNPEDGTWIVYVLCQVAVSGNVRPEFKSFNGCSSHIIYDRQMEKWEQQIQDSILKVEEDKRKSNARAIIASSFIPGMGQMLKGQGGAGAAFLVSEVALFGGGTACYFLGENQSRIMKSSVSYEDYAVARDNKRTWDIATYCCFGVGAAVHIANMVQAYYAKDKHLSNSNTAFIPALIPTNEFSHPQYAMGAGVQIKF